MSRSLASLLLPATRRVAVCAVLAFALPGALRAQQKAVAAAAAPIPFPDLGLTTAQRAKIASLTDATRAQQRAILARRAAGKPLTKADQEALAQVAQAHNAAYRAVLTPAQLMQLEAHRTAVEAQQRARSRRPRGNQ